MIEVFPLVGLAREIDATLNRAAIYLLVLLFLFSIGFFALKRFEGFEPEGRVNQLLVLGVFIGLWPQVMLGIKELVDAFNTFLIRDVFDLEWSGFEAIGSLIWEKVQFDTRIGDILFGSLAKLLAYALDLARLFLYYLFVLWFFFYKLMGPFILARGVLSDNLSVLRELLSEVSILFLWQTTFIFLLGFFSLAMKGAL